MQYLFKKNNTMEAKELRIGNLVYDINNKIIEIEEVLRYKISFSFKLGIGFAGYKSIKPIPLTEEWLIKLGFKEVNPKRGIISSFIKNGIQIDISNSGNYYYKNILILSIHQLQNLYFALTGEELTIK